VPELAEEQEVIEDIIEDLPDLAEGEEPEVEEDEDDEVLEISLGEESLTSEEDEESDAPAPAWVKDVRKTNRDLKKQNRELEAKLQAQVKAPEPIEKEEPLVKPTLESCDYDEQKFEEAVEGYHENKRLASVKAEERKALAEKEKNENQKFYDNYVKERASLKVADKDKIDEYEENVIEALSLDQQDWIIKSANNPAILTHALGNPKIKAKLQELSEIKDPIRFIRKTVELELQLKTSTSKRSKPKPEQSVKGGSKPTGGLQKSYEAALKKGDYTQAAKLKQQLK
jgi:hypothetical protein